MATPTVRIETNRAVGPSGMPEATAPGGFVFSAVAEGFTSDDLHFAPWKDLHYTWSFSDPGWYTRHDTDDLPWGRYYEVAGETVLVEDGTVPAGGRFLGNDKNVAYGPWVAHVWAPAAEAFARQRSMRFLVRCEVRTTPDAEPVVAEREVTLLNPDAIFARGQTFLIAARGDTSNPSDPVWDASAYPGATLCNTFDEAWGTARAQSIGRNHPARFLFRRGETHNHVTGGKSTRARGRIGRLQIGAYGAGLPPRLVDPDGWSGLSIQFGEADGPENECAYWGFDLVGPYDPSDPFSIARRPPNGLNLSWGRYKTVWDVHIAGFDGLVSAPPQQQGAARGSNTVIGNTFLADWYDYGIFWYDDSEWVGHCGLWIKQHPRTRIGEGKRDPRNKNQVVNDEGAPAFFADHGPYRCSTPGAAPVVFNLVDLRSANSWLGAVQPCLRHAIEAPPDDRIYRANFDRIRGENGQVVHPVVAGYSIGDPDDGQRVMPKLFLYDKIYEVQLQAGGSAMWAMGDATGIVIRNTISVIPDSPAMGRTVDTWVRDVEDPFDPRTFRPEVLDHGFELYNITFADLRSPENEEDRFSVPVEPTALDWAAYVVLDNNLTYTPARTGGAGGPLDDTILWLVTWNGARYDLDPLQEVYATPPDTARRFAPKPGSPAYEAAISGKVAIDDFFARLRTGRPSQGAVEPDDTST